MPNVTSKGGTACCHDLYGRALFPFPASSHPATGTVVIEHYPANTVALHAQQRPTV